MLSSFSDMMRTTPDASKKSPKKSPNSTHNSAKGMLSPASQERKAEFERLCNLNGRLKYYIRMVREKYPEELERVHNQHQREMASQKDRSDNEKQEMKEHFNGKIQNLEEEVARHSASNRESLKKIDQLHREKANFEKAIENLQTDLVKKENHINQLKEEKKTSSVLVQELEEELSELKKELADAQDEKAGAIQEIEENLRSQLNSQIELVDKLTEELEETKSNLENNEQELNSAYEERLEIALAEAKKVHQQNADKMLDDVERSYEKIFAEKEADIKRVTQGLQKENDELKEQKETILQEGEEIKNENNELQQSVVVLKAKIDELEKQYNNVSKSKANLTREIDSINKLLTEEEARLERDIAKEKTKNKESSVVVDDNTGGSRKRGRDDLEEDEEDVEPVPKRSDVDKLQVDIIDSSGDVIIKEVDAEGFFIRLQNVTSAPIQMDQWLLRSYYEDDAIDFNFSKDLVLEPEQYLTIITRLDEEEIQPDSEQELNVQWDTSEPLWNNEGGFVELFNQEGASVSAAQIELEKRKTCIQQ